MNSHYTNLFRFFFAFVDLLTLCLVNIVLMFTMTRIHGLNDSAYQLLFIFGNMAWLGSAYVTALYINDHQMNFERFSRKTVQCYILFSVVMLLFIFLYNFQYSRLFVMLLFAGFAFTLLITRILFIMGSEWIRNKRWFNKKVVLLGYNELSKKLAEHFASNSKTISVKGYFEDYENVHELSRYPILGNLNECVHYSIDHDITEIYSTISPEKEACVYEYAQVAEKNLIRFKFVPDFKVFVNRNIHLDYVNDIPILSLRSEPLEDIACQVKKRLFDIVVSLFVIVFILSWLAPLLAILIKLDSRGPVFFVQLRSGKNNKPFRCFKFRSLKKNSISDIQQVTRNDARYTKIGRFLRRTNIDEFPQFFNVFTGHMSVVGPRPHMLKHTQDYGRIMNEYMIRHFVKPGLTGWAQINGYRGEITEEEQLRKRIEHDIWYMENWNLWLDFKIVCLTLLIMCHGDRNAY
ncbi:MAG TPA: undecaprenyl-phosphate glucose phosphotransferase [Flavitalea sp.]|nr:undecaprenyl-phosphate glucose phosphotransferase [Flavitalea sp.]